MVSDMLALQKVLTRMAQKLAKNQVKVGLVGRMEVYITQSNLYVRQWAFRR
jgi:hypothetical protein